MDKENLDLNKYLDSVDFKTIITGFLEIAEKGLSTKNDIIEKIQHVKEILKDCDTWMVSLEEAIQLYRHNNSVNDEFGTIEEIQNKYAEVCSKNDYWLKVSKRLEKCLDIYRNFNKNICISNIRELLKYNQDVKIGQIEKEAGVRIGYMSRLEKEGNTTEPSIEFIVTAAKLLKVSVETLISIDLTGLTPTEEYLIKFFDKLKSDTLADKLDWCIEQPDDLNSVGFDCYGDIEHPLFSNEEFYEESEIDHPEQVRRIVFVSKSYGPKTYISGDCYNLRLKNGARLYLMNIEKSVHRKDEKLTSAKEIWMYIPSKGKQVLITTLDNNPISSLVDNLYSVVEERMKHPKVNKDVMNAIDFFMSDDFDDDPSDIVF